MFSKIQEEHISIAEHPHMWLQLMVPLTNIGFRQTVKFLVQCKISHVN